jgi:hypothetical protein
MAPTTNTDDSPLTNLAGFRVYHGASAAVLSSTVPVPGGAGASTHTITGLPVGQRFFGVRAYNSAGVDSDLSAIVSKTITSATNTTRTIGITVNPKPSTVSGLTVE